MKIKKLEFICGLVMLFLIYVVLCLVLKDLHRQSLLRKWNDAFLPSTSFYSSPAAVNLPQKGSLFCFVMTAEKFYKTRVPAVNSTWLKRCDHGQIFTTTTLEDDSIPFSTVFEGLSDDYDQLFFKSVTALYTTYTKISADFDWYFKADDDTYLIVENLKEILRKFNPKKPHFLGYYWKSHGGYYSGGSGYILSNAALKLFVEKAFGKPEICPFEENEDIAISRCMRNIGVSVGKNNLTDRLFVPIARNLRGRDPLTLASLHSQSPEDMYQLERRYAARMSRSTSH